MDRNDRIVEFRLRVSIGNNKYQPGDRVLMRAGCILCLYPESLQIRTTESDLILDVYAEDYPHVERAFRSMLDTPA